MTISALQESLSTLHNWAIKEIEPESVYPIAALKAIATGLILSVSFDPSVHFCLGEKFVSILSCMHQHGCVDQR